MQQLLDTLVECIPVFLCLPTCIDTIDGRCDTQNIATLLMPPSTCLLRISHPIVHCSLYASRNSLPQAKCESWLTPYLHYNDHVIRSTWQTSPAHPH